MFEFCKEHPTPWKIDDPNGAYMRKHKKFLYQPIWINDAKGKHVCYVGDNSEKDKIGVALAVANQIVMSVNAVAKLIIEDANDPPVRTKPKKSRKR